jgi:hypothetical protein
MGDVDRSDYGHELTQEESELVDALSVYLGAENLTLLSNFKSNAAVMLPPSGYAATVYRDATVRPDVFRGLHRLFRGVALVQIDTLDGELNEAARTAFRAYVNLFLRDVSPHPPKLTDTPDGGWVCELGRAGWVGLFSGRVVRPNHTRERTASHYMVCVAGLPEKTYLDLDAFLVAQKGTWGEVFGPKMDPIRALAAENRNRILAAAVTGLARALDMASPVIHRAKPFPTKAEGPGDPEIQKRLEAAFKIPLAGVPAWFTVPAVQPRDVGPVPETLRGYPLGARLADSVPYPSALAGVLDVICDDVVQTDALCMTVLMGACGVHSKVGVPVTNGATGDMSVYNYRGPAVWGLHSPTLGAVPFEPAIQALPAAPKSSNCTWADATVDPNRNVACEWVFATPSVEGEPAPMSRYGAPVESEVQLELDRAPGWMRVSVIDPFGGASAQTTFAGLRAVEYHGVV